MIASFEKIIRSYSFTNSLWKKLHFIRRKPNHPRRKPRSVIHTFRHDSLGSNHVSLTYAVAISASRISAIRRFIRSAQPRMRNVSWKRSVVRWDFIVMSILRDSFSANKEIHFSHSFLAQNSEIFVLHKTLWYDTSMNEKQKHPIREHAARDVPMTREYSKQLGVAVRENVKRILTKNYESIDEFIEEVCSAWKRWGISLSFVEYAPWANVEFSHYKSHEKVSFTEHEISLVKWMKEYDQRITDEWDILFLLPHHSHVHSPSFLILRVENIKRNYRRRQITEILEQYDTFITSTFHNVLAVNTDMSVTWLRNADSLNTFLRNHPPEWIRTHEKTYVVCMIDMNGFKNIYQWYVLTQVMRYSTPCLCSNLTENTATIEWCTLQKVRGWIRHNRGYIESMRSEYGTEINKKEQYRESEYNSKKDWRWTEKYWYSFSAWKRYTHSPHRLTTRNHYIPLSDDLSEYHEWE